MARLQLGQVTLCAVDTRSPALAAQSLQRSMLRCDFAQVLLFTHGWRPQMPPSDIDIVDIDVIRSGFDYSRFVLRRLPAHVQSSHVLVTQWDGFVLHPAAWTDEFLAYDYIGAPWPDQPGSRAVGNGGFSLRSRRFLQAGTDVRITEEHPEDTVMCRRYRSFLEEVHGIRFAPLQLAQRFAYENAAAPGPTFGFHGPYNLPAVLDKETLMTCVEALPNEFFRSRDARRMARAMLKAGMGGAAHRLLTRRRAAGRNDINTRVLAAVSGLMQAVQGWAR